MARLSIESFSIFNDLKKRGITLYLSECRVDVSRSIILDILMCVCICLDEVRHTFDLMNFYDKTDFHIIFVTTHYALMIANRELQNGVSFFFIYVLLQKISMFLCFFLFRINS